MITTLRSSDHKVQRILRYSHPRLDIAAAVTEQILWSGAGLLRKESQNSPFRWKGIRCCLQPADIQLGRWLVAIVSGDNLA